VKNEVENETEATPVNISIMQNTFSILECPEKSP